MPAPLSVAGHTVPHVEDTIVHATAIVIRRARSAFADGNVDRRVESAEIDIPARHSKDANVDPVAICLLDVYVDGENRRHAGVDAGPLAVEKPGTRA